MRSVASDVEVPLVDLAGSWEPGPSRDAVAARLREACETIGFLVITNHGIADEPIADLERAARGFFALPLDDKLASVGPPGVYRGYTPSEGSALAASRDVETPPDLCETYTVNRFDDPDVAARAGLRPGREAFFAPNVWPPEPADFQDVFTTYYAAMEALAGHLMRLMALALDLDETWFDDKIEHHITNLTVNHYPELDRPPLPGQLRRGAHSDWGSLTILHHDGQPGLQVQRGATWTDVPVVPDSFVVNLGDLMARWTNDRWVSTMHRVVVPPDERGDRLSVAFFHQPTYDAVIECIPTCASPDDPPKYPTTTSGEWILSMLGKTIY